MYCTCATSQKGKECERTRARANGREKVREGEAPEEVEREAGSRDEIELG